MVHARNAIFAIAALLSAAGGSPGCGAVFTRHGPLVYHRDANEPSRATPATPTVLSDPTCSDPRHIGTVTKKATLTRKAPPVRFKQRHEERIRKMAAQRGGEYITDLREESHKRRDTTVNYATGQTRTLDYYITVRSWDVWRCD